MTKRRKILLGVGALLVMLLLYLFAWPVPIEPIAWEAPAFNPNVWKTTGTLATAERIELPSSHGPEDIEVDSQGRIYAGLEDGRILRWDAVDKEPVVFADTGGRPLGLDWDQDGRLLVADGVVGVLAIDRDGKIEVLATECSERPLGLADDLAAAADGSIWFSDASRRFGVREWKHDFFESKPNGRLCVWEPTTNTAREVVGDLYFANGVAVDPGQEFVLVTESTRYRVRRVWIAGERTGEHEVIIDNLPGIPDGISTDSNGIFWIAIASPRDPLIDGMAGSPWLRRMVFRLPPVVQPAPKRTARIIGIDRNGKVVHDLFDPKGERIWVVTSVQERGGHLYLGSLADHAWARIPVP
jgi:sugar lactone lactonase YvrE